MRNLFGFNLRVLRVMKRITQAELAKKVQLSQSTIAQIESGRKDTTVSVLLRLAKALQVKPGILLTDALIRDGEK